MLIKGKVTGTQAVVPILVDANGRPLVSLAGDTSGLASETTLSAVSGKLPSTLGAKTGANSLSIVPATDAGLATAANQSTQTTAIQEVRDRIGSRAAATHPNVLITLFNAFSLTGTGAATDLNITEIDYSGGTFQGVDAFRLTGKTVNGATSPGANRTFTLKLYWSDEQITPATDIPVRLANRKIVLGTFTLPNVTSSESPGSGERHWEFGDIQLPKARYFYLTVDKSAFNTSGTSALTVYAVRVV